MAQAALLTVKLAASMDNYPLILEGDTHIASLAINHPRLTTDWHINPIISDPHNHLLFFKSWTASKISKSANSRAHQAARWAASHQIIGSFPTNSLPV
jgi:hypothetical protein